MSEVKEFTVIGISDSSELFFAPDVTAAIKNSKVFSGGKRHHELVAHLLPSDAVWIDISVPLETVFKQYAPYSQITVFRLGRPSFLWLCSYTSARISRCRAKGFSIV